MRSCSLKLKPSENLIVITGCDSGFGQLSALDLASRGFAVVAVCLTEDGAASLKDKVTLVVVADITVEADVARLVREVSKLVEEGPDDQRSLRLWALVNNAGIGASGYVDWVSMNTFRRVMEVNFFGLVAVTKAFLPLLKNTRGSRILNMSSMAGFTGGPMFGPYSASKHAVEGFAKCLRVELRPWGIHVCNLNPAFMRTPIVGKAVEGAEQEFLSAPPEIRAQYSMDILDHARRTLELPGMQEDPVVVVRAIATLLLHPSPPFATYPGIAAKVLRLMFLLPHSMLEYFLSCFHPAFGPNQHTLQLFQGQ